MSRTIALFILLDPCQDLLASLAYHECVEIFSEPRVRIPADTRDGATDQLTQVFRLIVRHDPLLPVNILYCNEFCADFGGWREGPVLGVSSLLFAHVREYDILGNLTGVYGLVLDVVE